MKSFSAKNVSYIALSVVILTVCAWTCVPVGVIPFTLQTLGIYLVLLIMGGKKGFVAVAVYVLLGIIGVPVFSGFRGGIGIITGATGGFVIGFLLMAGIFCVITLRKQTFLRCVVGLLVGLFADYLFGTVWFIAFYSGMHTDAVIEALSVCVLPFILPDVLKLIPAFAVWTKTKSILRP